MPFDLIYSSGLFDYLDDQTFILAVTLLYSQITSKGQLLIGNLSVNDYAKTGLWYLDDWAMHHRSADDLLKLALASGIKQQQISIESEGNHVNLFLCIQKNNEI